MRFVCRINNERIYITVLQAALPPVIHIKVFYMVIKVSSDENFSKLLSENDSVLAFFRADWCLLCDYAENILIKLEAKYDTLSLFIIDFDTTETLTGKYGIIGVPTVVPFKYGKLYGCFPGLREDSFYEKIANEVCTRYK
jgi:thiol-disulfide isomerase/thioredoxin